MHIYNEIDLMLLVAAIISGLVFGSFATAVAYRLPRGIQFVTGSSRCPSCNHRLTIPDLFPVFSWVYLRGKCRHCSAEFGSSYILTEITLAAMFAATYLHFGLSWEALTIASLALCLIILTVIDFEHYIIPDSINLIIFVLAIIYQILSDAPLQHFFTGPLFGLALGLSLRWGMYIWKGKEGLGMGDVKFLPSVGLFLDLDAFITFLFLSGVIGMLIALVWKLQGKGERFPFGPALAMSLFICIAIPGVHAWWRGAIESLVMLVL